MPVLSNRKCAGSNKKKTQPCTVDHEFNITKHKLCGKKISNQ